MDEESHILSAESPELPKVLSVDSEVDYNLALYASPAARISI